MCNIVTKGLRGESLRGFLFWPVLCRLCVGNEEGSDCAGSTIFGILAIESFL